MRVLPLFAAASLLWAPADLSAGSDQNGPVAEFVTFRLNPGVEDSAFLEAAKATGPVLEKLGGSSARFLTKDAEGVWTDIVIWSDLETALQAAKQVVGDPEFAPFGSMINPETVHMRHVPIAWSM